MDTGGGYSFKSRGKRGAVVVLRDGGVQYKTEHQAVLEEYIYKHHRSWHTLAVTRKLDVRVEELVLVSSCVKTAGWALAAYDETAAAHDFSLSLGANGMFTFQPGANTEKKHHAGIAHREGPAAGSSGRQDQCVFVEYYKCLPRGFGVKLTRELEDLKYDTTSRVSVREYQL